MKAYRKDPEFKPVVIEIESEDELLYLWHCLNIKKEGVLDGADSRIPFPHNIEDYKMWKLIDKIVRPA
jgi:hypothetical protein